MKTTFQNGNREVTVSIIGNADWSKGDLKRVYFDLSFEGAKLAPIDKIYEVISGGTADSTVVVAGRTFGYKLGICCDSKTKRAYAAEAVKSLVEQIAA